MIIERIEESKSSKRIDELKKLRRLLKQGVVEFLYRKKDNKERKAKGTLKTSLIPETDGDDERKTKLDDDRFYYYDLKREDWRCFIKDNFIEIIDIEKEKTNKIKQK